jgi:aspartate aminotransferase
LRAAIAAKFQRDNAVTVSPEEVAVTTGAKQALYNALQVLVGPGDEVLIPAPYWVSYPDMVALAGGKPVIVDWTEGFQINLEDMERKITPRTRLVLLNTPNNPTGAVYPREALARVAALAQQHDLSILSDEIYEKLVFGDARHVAVASLSPAVAARTVTVNGCSKAYAMTGWRLGYAAGPKEVIQAMVKVQSQSTSCVPGFIQKAAGVALREGEASIPPMVAEFDRRRLAVLAQVRRWPGAKVAEPRGAFYVFPDLSALLGKRLDGTGTPVADDMALSDLLLNEARVAVVPGMPFGAPGHLRLSIAASQAVLDKACQAVDTVLRRLR